MVGGHELDQILRSVGVLHNVALVIRLADLASHASQHSFELLHSLEDGVWGIVSNL